MWNRIYWIIQQTLGERFEGENDPRGEDVSAWVSDAFIFESLRRCSGVARRTQASTVFRTRSPETHHPERASNFNAFSGAWSGEGARTPIRPSRAAIDRNLLVQGMTWHFDGCKLCRRRFYLSSPLSRGARRISVYLFFSTTTNFCFLFDYSIRALEQSNGVQNKY